MRKCEKFIVDVCEEIFGIVSTENKKKIKKVVAENEIEDMLAYLNFDRIKHDELIQDIKKRLDKPKFFNIPALSGLEDLFTDEEVELKFGDKVIEAKDSTVFFNEDDDEKTENQFCDAENYLLYILMFTFSDRKTTAEELYKFSICSNNRINIKNVEEFEKKIVNLGRKLVETQARIVWEGKTSRLLTNFEQNGKQLLFDCSNFKQMIDKKLISIPQKLMGKGKFSVVLKKLMIIKEIRDWKRYGSKYSPRIVVGKIERKVKSEISNSFLKEFLEHLKGNNFIGECCVKTQHFARSIIFAKSNQKPLTPYVKNGNLIAYYLKGTFAKKIIGKYYTKANYHILSEKVRFDDPFMKITEEEKQMLSNYIMMNLEK